MPLFPRLRTFRIRLLLETLEALAIHPSLNLLFSIKRTFPACYVATNAMHTRYQTVSDTLRRIIKN